MTNEIGNLEIDSQEIMSGLSVLEQSLSILQSDIRPMVLSDFDALRKTDLFGVGLDEILKQVEIISTSNQNMITKIAVHVNEIIELERQLSTEGEEYESYSYEDNGDNNIKYFDFPNIDVDTVQQGKSINKYNVIDIIPKLNESNQIKLINFLNMNKEKNVKLNNLLFNVDKSGILMKYLKKFCGNTVDSDKVETTDDSKILQKELLKLLNKNNRIGNVLYKDTVLVAKTYLENIARDNNITFEELIVDDTHNDLFRNSIKNLYDENINNKYKVDDTTVRQVKLTVLDISQKINVPVEKLFSDNKYVPFLKGVY